VNNVVWCTARKYRSNYNKQHFSRNIKASPIYHIPKPLGGGPIDRQTKKCGGRESKKTDWQKIECSRNEKNSITCHVPVRLRAVHYLLESYSFIVSILLIQ